MHCGSTGVFQQSVHSDIPGVSNAILGIGAQDFTMVWELGEYLWCESGVGAVTAMQCQSRA